MLLRILIKFFTITLGILALNALCWGLFLLGGKVLHPWSWAGMISVYFSEHLFIKINDFFPFSWMISLIGFLLFVFYDYFRYKQDGYEQNIIKDFLIDIKSVGVGLIIVVIVSFPLMIFLYAVQLFYDIFLIIPLLSIEEIYSNYTKYGYSMPDWAYHFNISHIASINPLASFIIRVIVIMPSSYLILYYVINYKAPIVVNWKDYDKKINKYGETWFSQLLVYLTDRFNVLFKFTLLLYLVYLIPTTFQWAYPIVLIWLGLIPIPDFAFPFYVYSILLLFLLFLIILLFSVSIESKRKRKRALLREEIKNEILNEINNLNQKE